MAQHYIGFNRGKEGLTISDYTTGTSTGSTDMEFRFDDTKSLTKLDVQKFLDVVADIYFNLAVNNGGPTLPQL